MINNILSYISSIKNNIKTLNKLYIYFYTINKNKNREKTNRNSFMNLKKKKNIYILYILYYKNNN